MELEAWREAVDQLPGGDPRDHCDGASLVELHRDLSRLEAYVAAATALFDSGKEWAADGERTAAAWLATQCKTPRRATGRDVKVARAVRDLPVIAEVWRAGEINTAALESIGSTRKASASSVVGLQVYGFDVIGAHVSPPHRSVGAERRDTPATPRPPGPTTRTQSRRRGARPANNKNKERDAMAEQTTTPARPEVPDSTAVRVALWRALHVELDAAPHVLDDRVGLALADPAAGWRDRGDMHPQGTASMRAGIVARARVVEDLVAEQAAAGVLQYVLLGAGLDTFAERRAEQRGPSAWDDGLVVYEVDQPATSAWKRRRLADLGYHEQEEGHLRLVPVDFEAGGSWRDGLVATGFDPGRPAVVASTGVIMYLTHEGITDTLRQVAQLTAGSTLAATFMLPPALLPAEEGAMLERVIRAAAGSGTPFLSLFAPADIVALAREAGFAEARSVPPEEIVARYFDGRSDGLVPATAEQFLIATT
jgi:methyltransferase (TIGR00027 family)